MYSKNALVNIKQLANGTVYVHMQLMIEQVHMACDTSFRSFQKVFKVCLPKFATDIIVYISRPMNGTLDLKSSAESPGIWL